MSRVRRTVWGVGDQGLSSLTNFGLAIVLARNLDLAAFGAASLGFALYIIALSTSRAIASEPFTVRHSGVAPSDWRDAAAMSVGVGLVAGLVIGIGLVVVGGLMLALGGTSAEVGSVLIATGVVLPGLLMQDAWRLVFFADHRPHAALVNDLVWAIALVITLGATVVSGAEAAWMFVLAWGIAGAIAGLFGIVQARLRPAPLRARAWWRQHRDLISRYFVESLVLSTASQSRLIVISAIGGLALGGAIRLGQVVLNTIHPLTQGMSLTIIPEAVATARRSIHALDRMLVVVTAAMAAIPLAWGIVAWLLPVDFGEAIFGDSWAVARLTIPGMTLVFVAAGLQSGALVGLRATASATHSLRARMVTAVLALGGAAVGAMTGDPALCAWAMGIASLIGVPVWWAQYLTARRRPVGDGAPPRMADASPTD